MNMAVMKERSLQAPQNTNKPRESRTVWVSFNSKVICLNLERSSYWGNLTSTGLPLSIINIDKMSICTCRVSGMR